MYKNDLALNNLQRLICHQTKQKNWFFSLTDFITYQTLLGFLFWNQFKVMFSSSIQYIINNFDIGEQFMLMF